MLFINIHKDIAQKIFNLFICLIIFDNIFLFFLLQAREERLEQRRKSQVNQIHFGFGSSTPRMIEPRLDDGYRR